MAGTYRLRAQSADRDPVALRMLPTFGERSKAMVENPDGGGVVDLPALEQRSNRDVPVIARREPGTGPELVVEPAKREHRLAAQGHPCAQTEPTSRLHERCHETIFT